MDHRVAADDLLRDVPVLRDKIAQALDVSGETAPEAFAEALRFLELAVVSGETLSPPRAVDLVWHEFILCTRVYADYCRAHFGRFVHHQPGGDRATNRRQLKRTLSWYRRSFGLPDPRYWGVEAEVMHAECGACQQLAAVPNSTAPSTTSESSCT